MLKQYDKPEDVPEALREHYSRREDGKMHADIPNDHPAVKHNATLLKEKNDAIAERDTAKSELDSAKASGLPRGHEAVPKADAELVKVIKEAGITKVEDFATLKTDHDTFKVKAETAEREKHATEIGELMGWDKEKTARLVPKVFDLSQVESRTGADGKKTLVAKVKQGDGTFIEKPFADVVTTTPDLNDLLPSLKSESGGTRVHGSTPGAGSGGNLFDSIREGVAAQEKGAAAESKTLEQRLHIAA
jgi:hypothetical protein